MIYLDNAATTPPLTDVVAEICRIQSQVYGNPSSTYSLGRAAKAELETARRTIAAALGAKPAEIIFTSGGTESNNTALRALAQASPKKHIISSCIEHPSVLNTLKALEEEGYRVTYLPVDQEGRFSLEQVKAAVRPDTAFVTLMTVNNETGALQPVEAIANYLFEEGIPFHTDAVQAFGTIAMDLSQLPVTMLSVSGHKIHGPKGIGFLFVRLGTSYKPLLAGGGQESGRRSGTENLANIVGLAKAVELLDTQERYQHDQKLQALLLEELEQAGIDFQINGALDQGKKSPHVINLYLPGVSSSKLLIQLDLSGVAVSAGSACSAGSLQPSRILLAQYPNQANRASQSIRLSFSIQTQEEDIKGFVATLKKLLG